MSLNDLTHAMLDVSKLVFWVACRMQSCRCLNVALCYLANYESVYYVVSVVELLVKDSEQLLHMDAW